MKKGSDTMKTCHSINDILSKIRRNDGDAIVVFKHEKHGLLWAGRAKFTMPFKHTFFRKIPVSVYTDSVGAHVIVVSE